jgi:hypothetical protein
MRLGLGDSDMPNDWERRGESEGDRREAVGILIGVGWPGLDRDEEKEEEGGGRRFCCMEEGAKGWRLIVVPGNDRPDSDAADSDRRRNESTNGSNADTSLLSVEEEEEEAVEDEPPISSSLALFPLSVDPLSSCPPSPLFSSPSPSIFLRLSPLPRSLPSPSSPLSDLPVMVLNALLDEMKKLSCWDLLSRAVYWSTGREENRVEGERPPEREERVLGERDALGVDGFRMMEGSNAEMERGMLEGTEGSWGYIDDTVPGDEGESWGNEPRCCM